ncbi:MAG: NAD(P)H-dependent oxidoreductase [Phenylobacterium sp.]|uniref:NADPH-dependent FMN reductase n=1 Tax=Phenylobacterium sp. TaxID=1871053 RepID=UPI0012190100|nr:NADPH-dependent FMN reductase [Phenylobacterium sp.]TAJ70303.1 MAG: NAD(P)H-dependent oxidoreductase [Phenylobacterium sp.]
MRDEALRIVALGGTPDAGSSTERALGVAVRAAKAAGAEVSVFDGTFMTRLPFYRAAPHERDSEAQAFVEAVRQADGMLIASPGWHGSISGLTKNAIDYIEETARDPRPYLDGVPVGLIATAYGWQATGSTLATLRAIVHALRGWPTPLGAAVNTSGGVFQGEACVVESVQAQLESVARQVVEFAAITRLGRAAATAISLPA